MTRTDRLHALIAMLRHADKVTAEDAAARLGVTTRTVYRDMDVLQSSGLPIQGERGVGYRLTAPVTLPPLNLSFQELEALHLGLAVVAEAADPELRSAAESLAEKIDVTLSSPAEIGRAGLSTYPMVNSSGSFRLMSALRAAIRSRQKLKIRYRSEDRIIHPLLLDYWGRTWTATAWCELRGEFRAFRVDRIEDLTQLPELFYDEPGKRLQDVGSRMPLSDQ